MTALYASQISRLAEFFPSELWWEIDPHRWVGLDELLGAKAIYESRFAAMGLANHSNLVISKSDLREMVRVLEFEESAVDEMVDIAFVLSGWLMTAEHQRAFKNDHAAILGHFTKTSIAARKLADLLGELPPKVADIVTEMIDFDPPDAVFSKATNLEVQLINLSAALKHVHDRLGRRRGRHRDAVLKIAVHHLVKTLERLTGEQVETRQSHLDGRLGQFVMTFFRKLPSTPPEATLVRLINGIGKSAPDV